MPSNDATPTCSVLFCFACAKRLIFSSIGILVSSSSGFSGLISQYGSLIKGVISITLPFKYFDCQSFGNGFLTTFSSFCFFNHSCLPSLISSSRLRPLGSRPPDRRLGPRTGITDRGHGLGSRLGSRTPRDQESIKLLALAQITKGARAVHTHRRLPRLEMYQATLLVTL